MSTPAPRAGPRPLRRPRWRRRRPGLPFVLAMLFGAVMALVPAAPAQAATWTVVTTPNVATGTNLFTGIDARSPSEVWAVGHADHSPSQPFQRPLAARWNGASWQLVGTPALGGDGWFRGVDGSSSTNVWAVGMHSVPAGGGSVGAAPLAELWNGSTWSLRPAATPTGASGASLEGVKAFSATSAWAVGNAGATSAPFARTLIERWDGTRWTVVPSPNPDPNVNLLSDVDGAAPDDVWAIGNFGSDGYGGTLGGVVLRWNGSTWSQVAVPGATSSDTLRLPVLEDVLAISRNDVWIVGRAFHFGLFRMVPIFMHWNGTGWQHGFVANAPAGGFTGITALSPTRVYAVGDVTARWNGSAWAVENTGVTGRPIDAAATGSSTVWAAGYRYDQASATIRSMTMRTNNG